MHDSCPVLVAVAQRTWREPEPRRSPVDAMHEVATAALADSGRGGLGAVLDAIATVRFIADAQPKTAALLPRFPGNALAERLGCRAATVYQPGSVGGNTPQALVNHFAAELAAGRHRAVLICGAELIATLFHALQHGGDIAHWTRESAGPVRFLGEDRPGTNAIENAHGLFEPVNTYPLFENAIRHAAGRGFVEHQQHIAALCSRMSAVAAANPLAWRPTRLSAEQIACVEPRNRMIGFPYTRAMNATLAVDMAAAVILTTAGVARALDIDPARYVYLRAGADLEDHWWVSERASHTHSPAIRAAACAVFAQAALAVGEIALFDVYSCFPSAVQIGCEGIGLAVDDPRGVTITGGLGFFGGPGNNYSLHAIAEMVARLRGRERGHGLVSALGYYLTKHSLGIYSSEAPRAPYQPVPMRPLQAAVDALGHAELDPEPAGAARLDTWTVAFGRDGPQRGIVVGTLDSGRRFVANTPADPASLERLIASDPVGQRGRVSARDGRNLFEF